MSDMKANKLKVKIWLGFRGRKVNKVEPIKMNLPFDEQNQRWYFDQSPVFVIKNNVVLSIDCFIYEVGNITNPNWIELDQKEILKREFFTGETIIVYNSRTYFYDPNSPYWREIKMCKSIFVAFTI